MNANENTATLSEGHFDDLESISGIGPTFARALNQIGINQFADLTRYSPQQLANALAERANVKVSADRIETNDWVHPSSDYSKKIAHAIERRLVFLCGW